MTHDREGETEGRPFAVGDIVETIKGAKFWGRVSSVYNLNSSFPGKAAEWRADVLATDPGFEGTLHVYPTKQLAHRAAEGEAVMVPRDVIEEASDLLRLYERSPAWKALADRLTAALTSPQSRGRE